MFHLCCMILTCLFVEIVFSLQQAFSQDILEFFHKHIFRIKEADKSADDIRIFRFSILYIHVRKRPNSRLLDLTWTSIDWVRHPRHIIPIKFCIVYFFLACQNYRLVHFYCQFK